MKIKNAAKKNCFLLVFLLIAMIIMPVMSAAYLEDDTDILSEEQDDSGDGQVDEFPVDPEESFSEETYPEETYPEDIAFMAMNSAGAISIEGIAGNFNTLKDAIVYANKMSSAVIEISGNINQIGDVSIESDITIIGAVGDNSAEVYGIMVNGGCLTLGNGDTTRNLTIESSGHAIEVISGTLNVKDGVVIKTAAIAVLFNGGDGAISGGRFEGYVALDVNNGAKLREISGGEFYGEDAAVKLYQEGSRIERISGGMFVKSDTSNNKRDSFCVAQGAVIGEISGGEFIGGRSALNITNGRVEKISGGFFGLDTKIQPIGILIQYASPDVGIGTISGGVITGETGIYLEPGTEIGIGVCNAGE